MQEDISMALIKCPECEREISDQAPTCPHCGVPLKQTELNITTANESSTPVWGIIGIIAGLGALILPYFVAVFLLPVSFICGIVAYRKGQKQSGITTIILATLAFCWVIYVSMSLNAIVNGNKSFPLAGQNQTTQYDPNAFEKKMEEMKATINNGRLSIRGDIDSKRDGDIVYLLAKVKNVSGKKITALSATFTIYDKNGNVTGNAADFIAELAPEDIWSIKATAFEPNAFKYRLTNVEGIIVN